MRKYVSAILISAVALLAGCNTIAGAGRDVQAAGSAVENAAEGR